MPQNIQLKLLSSDANKVTSISDGGLFLDVSSIQMFDANGAPVVDSGAVVTVGVSADGLSYQSKVASSNASLGGFEFKHIKVSVSGRTTASTVVVDVKVCSISEAMTSDSYKSRLAGLFTATPYTAATLPDPAKLGVVAIVSKQVRNTGLVDVLQADPAGRFNSIDSGPNAVGRFIKGATSANTVKLRKAIAYALGGFAGVDNRLVWIGDSTTVAVGANNVADGITSCRDYSVVSKFASMMKAKYGTSACRKGNLFTGHNIQYASYGIYNPNAVLTNVTINNSYTGGANSVFTQSATGATIVYTPGEAFTSLTVTYIQGPGLGSFTVQVDGGTSLGTTSTANATKGINSVTYSGLSGSAASTITVTFVGAANSVFVQGILTTEGKSSLNNINYGAAGLKASNFNDAADAWRASYNPAVLNPAVVFIQLGINDCKDGAVTAEQYAADMTTLVNNWKSVGAEVYIVSKLPSSTTYNAYTTQDRQDAFVDAAYYVSHTIGVPFIDLYGYLGAWSSLNSTALTADGLHGNAGLYAKEAKFHIDWIEFICNNF